MAEKRKHVVFAEEAAPPAPTVSAGPVIHPSRAAAATALRQPTADPAVKKPKVSSRYLHSWYSFPVNMLTLRQTAAQKRYLKAKGRKYKKIKAAKKASAPKNKSGDGVVDSTSNGNAEAGPSSPRPHSAVNGDSASSEKPVKKSKKTDKGKAKEDGADGLPVPGGADDEESARLLRKQAKRAKREARRTKGEAEDVVEDMVVPGGAEDEESHRLQRKQEKRAKREARRAKREAEEEEEEEAPGPQLLSTQPADAADSDDDEDVSDLDDAPDSSDLDDVDSIRSLSGSPPPLEAFPLPTPAPAPDASLLSRQGLPTGLNEATFIPQDLRLAVDSLKVTRGDEVLSGLSDRMKKRLAELDITEFFAVQAYMLPKLLSLRLIPWPFDPRNDFLISAPTGSGKTLAYCIPIIEMLAQRVVTRLRALIVLPTRDLVVQVRETLEMLSKGTSLKVGNFPRHKVIEADDLDRCRRWSALFQARAALVD